MVIRSVELREAPRMKVRDAHEAWEHGDPLVFVDVRDRGAYERQHLPGARHIPLREILRHSQGLPEDALILTY